MSWCCCHPGRAVIRCLASPREETRRLIEARTPNRILPAESSQIWLVTMTAESGRTKLTSFRPSTGPSSRSPEISASGKTYIDYKDTESLKKMVSGNGKILSRKRTGATAMEQRMVARSRQARPLHGPASVRQRGRVITPHNSSCTARSGWTGLFYAVPDLSPTLLSCEFLRGNPAGNVAARRAVARTRVSGSVAARIGPVEPASAGASPDRCMTAARRSATGAVVVHDRGGSARAQPFANRGKILSKRFAWRPGARPGRGCRPSGRAGRADRARADVAQGKGRLHAQIVVAFGKQRRQRRARHSRRPGRSLQHVLDRPPGG